MKTTNDQIKRESLGTMRLLVGNALFGLDLWSSMTGIEGLQQTAQYKFSIFALENLKTLLEGFEDESI